ncbi:sensor histidine kinase [Flavisolibacter nicotianae]|uniref:sensor histidine kinase n=1 Tax=Flavisolibacter nicotianae TaxID=2364882 RepID=UPI000EB0DFBB|nr:PAS domain S-box protein [Flavisolibacter nicotianae]
MTNQSKPAGTGAWQEQLKGQQRLLDFSPDVLCSFDSEGRFLMSNTASQKVWGYFPDELVGRCFTELVVPEDREAAWTIVAAAKADGDVRHFQNRTLRKDGSVVPILWMLQWEKGNGVVYAVAKDATEKVREEKTWKRQEDRLLRAYKLAGIGWWEWDVASQRSTISDELYELYGLRREDYPDFTIAHYYTLIHPDDITIVQQANTNSLQGRPSQYKHRMIRPSGEVIYVVNDVRVILDANGNVVVMYGTTKDITESKKAELALRSSEQRLTQTLENIDDGFITMDRQWTVLYINRKMEEMLPRTRKDIVGKNFWKELGDAVPQKYYSEYHRAFAENKPVHFEEYDAALGTWVEVSAYPSAEGLSIYVKDITERKQQQEALRESNQRYEYVTKATSDAIWDWDLQTNELFWGAGVQAIFGHHISKQNANMESWMRNVHPDDLERVMLGLQNVIGQTGNIWIDKYRYQKNDGSYAYVIDKGFVIRDETGKATRMVGAMQDITLQREAEQIIKVSAEQFRLLFFKSPKPKWIFRSEDWQITEVNQAAIDLYGYSREEFLSLRIPDLKVEADLPEFYSLMEHQIEQYQTIVRHVKKNGEVFYSELSTNAIDLATGRHFIVSGDDMTDKLRLQQKLIEEKIAAQKEIAKAILDTQERERSEIGKELHDNVNQLLTTAKLYIENIHYFPEQREAFVQKGVSLLQRSIDEIRFLSKQLVTPVMHDIGFEATIEELISHYQSLQLFEIGLHYAICEEVLDQGLKLTIYRIIQEQLNNIVKYAQASLVQVAVEYGENELKVVISDNGVGFDSRKISKGLGLKNMKNRADVYKGQVDIQAEPGEGSTITVTFPLLEQVTL